MPINPDYAEWYGDDWKLLAAQLKAAAGHCCQQCGAKHGTCIGHHPDHPERWYLIEGESEFARAISDGDKVIEVQVGVAHLNHQPWDRSPSNLKVLCRGCHLRHDAPHHHQTRKANRRKQAIVAGQMEFEL
jgi:hypothetical protein